MKLSFVVNLDQTRVLFLAQHLANTTVPMEIVERETDQSMERFRPVINNISEMFARILSAIVAARVLFPEDNDQAMAFMRSHHEWIQMVLDEDAGPTGPA